MKDIQVIDVDQITRRVRFVIKPVLLSGIFKLIQIVILSLLNTAGRDVLDPEKGGGVPTLIGRNFDSNDDNELFGEVAQIVKKTETEVIEDQLGLQDDPEEKLFSLQIISLDRSDIFPDEISVKIRIINEAGRASDILL